MFMRRAILSILAFLYPIVATAQEPSIEDTISWLHAHIPDTTVEFKKEDLICEYSLNELYLVPNGNPDSGRIFLDYEADGCIDFSGYLDELSYDGVYAYAEDSADNNICTIILECHTGKCMDVSWNKRRSYARIFLPSRYEDGIGSDELCVRVSSAFRHLIKLSGGRSKVSKDLF